MRPWTGVEQILGLMAILSGGYLMLLYSSQGGSGLGWTWGWIMFLFSAIPLALLRMARGQRKSKKG